MTTEITKQYESLFNIEEMRGTANGRTRHVRIELSSQNEYTSVLNGGVMAMGGQLIEVAEFLAPPLVLICSRCNTPGHMKRECKAEHDRCRRYGENRSRGEYKECIIICHHCKGEHESTSYQCPIVDEFRKELIARIQNRPNLLPHNVQLFIPSEYRAEGEREKRTLFNNNGGVQSTQQQHNQLQVAPANQKDGWPCLSNNNHTRPTNAWMPSTPWSGKNIWNEMFLMQNKFDALKDRLDKQDANLMNEHREQKFKLGAIAFRCNREESGNLSIWSSL
jgi:hypothetical protein